MLSSTSANGWVFRSKSLDAAHDFRESLTRLTRAQHRQRRKAATELDEYRHYSRRAEESSDELRSQHVLSVREEELKRAMLRHESDMAVARQSIRECRDAIDAHGEEQFNYLVARVAGAEQEREHLRQLDSHLRGSMRTYQERRGRVLVLYFCHQL